MIKPFYFIAALLALSIAAHAQTESKIEFTPYAGYQQQNLHWSIAGNSAGQSPNVYSELKWMHNSGFAGGAALKVNVWKELSVFADYNRLSISSGKIDDTDYGSDNRTNPIYQGHYDSNKGASTLFKTGAGYQVVHTRLFALTPSLGFVKNWQSLYILDNSGQVEGLNSTYISDWKGAFAQLDARLALLPKLQLAGNLMYSQVSYNAHADWNLIQNFQHPVSYRHHASGYGLDAGLRLIYHINQNFDVHTGGSYFNWQTGKGTDRLYLTDGSVDLTQMNGSFLNGFQVNAGLSFVWGRK